MKNLLTINENHIYTIKRLSPDIPILVSRRLMELGFVEGNKIVLLLKNKLAKAGIIRLWSTMLSLDYFILSCIEVE